MICTARIALAGVNGRIDTTIGPWNGPASAVNRGAVHRHIAAARDVTQLDPVGHQRFLERERAADDEAHQIVPPVFADVLRLGDQLAVTPDPVARQVGADVEILAEPRHTRITRRRVPISGQGFGLSWQKRRKSPASACGKMARLPCT